MIKILIVFPGNGAKFDNVVVDAIKLILLIYNNFSIVKKVESVNKLSSGKSSQIDEASSVDLSILLWWSATRFCAPLLSRISKSNSWSQSIHLISRGFDSAFFIRYLRAARSVNTTTGEPSR